MSFEAEPRLATVSPSITTRIAEQMEGETVASRKVDADHQRRLIRSAGLAIERVRLGVRLAYSESLCRNLSRQSEVFRADPEPAVCAWRLRRAWEQARFRAGPAWWG